MLSMFGSLAIAADNDYHNYFMSTKSDETNLRVGPGKRYPIRWVYRKSSIPVKIIDRNHNWLQTKGMNGETGWIHRNLLSHNRSAFIANTKQAIIHRTPEDASPAIIKAGENVIVRLLECQPNWCKINIANRTGWVKKNNLWGISKDEIF